MDLIDISIKKFLSPDMTLLVESQQGSALNEIGCVMKTFIKHEDWELRDSALSLLLTCTEIAFISKYFKVILNWQTCNKASLIELLNSYTKFVILV